MSGLELVKTRFKVKLREEQQETRQRIEIDDRENQSRGVFGSGPHVESGSKIYVEGVERLVVALLKELRQDSMLLAPNAFAQLWEATGSFLAEQLAVEFKRRKESLKSKFEQRGRWGTSMDMVVGQIFNQHASGLRLDIHYRIEEAKQSYALFAVPSRPPTIELLALVDEVKRLVSAQGDITEFLKQNSSRLERIGEDIKRVGLDVDYSADVLMRQDSERFSNKNAVSALVSGVSTNGVYDGVKVALGALFGLLGS